GLTDPDRPVPYRRQASAMVVWCPELLVLQVLPASRRRLRRCGTPKSRSATADRLSRQPELQRSYPGQSESGPKGSVRDLAGLDARGAGVEALRGPIDDRAHPLDVRVPATGGAAV